MPTTRLFLVRHGATTLSAEDRFAGATDVDLSAEGRSQAQQLGRRLADEQIVEAYCSPLRRTVAVGSAQAGRLPSALLTMLAESRGKRACAIRFSRTSIPQSNS